jgi:hypothetical protein
MSYDAVRAYLQCGLKPTAAAIITTFDIITYTQAWRAQVPEARIRPYHPRGVSNVSVGDMTSPWTKNNKSYILFGSTFQMPTSQSSRPRVLLFDIGGVCVCQD